MVTARQAATRRRDRRALFALCGFVLVLLAGAGAYRALLGAAPPAIGGAFTLTDADGAPRSRADFRGRYVLMFFGYTGCTDVCPRTLIEMSEALQRLDPDARHIQPLFVTVDPHADTPDRLRRYIGGFSSHLIGLTGSAGQIDHVERLYHVVAERPADGAAGEVDHSAVLYLLDRHGDFLAPIPAGADRMQIIAALRRYVVMG